MKICFWIIHIWNYLSLDVKLYVNQYSYCAICKLDFSVLIQHKEKNQALNFVFNNTLHTYCHKYNTRSIWFYDMKDIDLTTLQMRLDQSISQWLLKLSYQIIRKLLNSSFIKLMENVSFLNRIIIAFTMCKISTWNR